jgi:hypothetical protein
MTATTTTSTAARAAGGTALADDRSDAWMLRAGGIAALLVAIGYIVTIPIYAAVGVPPEGGAAWIDYGAGRTGAWWAIAGLSVATDLLFVPLAFALFAALKQVHRDAMLIASSFVLLFVALDLAVTWSNYAALISLADRFPSVTDAAERTALLGAAEYASAVLASTLEAVYSIVTLSIGILVAGLVLLRGGPFGRTTAWLGVLTGIVAIASVVSSLFAPGLGVTIIVGSTLTIVWLLLVGARLLQLGRGPRPR